MRGRRKRPRWTDRDRLLLLAFEEYEASLCGSCGQPRSRSMNPDMAGWYEVKVLTCHGCAALDAHRDEDQTPGIARKPLVIDARPSSDVPPPWSPDIGPDDEQDEAAPDS